METAIGQFQGALGDPTLKILELNPRFLGGEARGELHARAEVEDVVVLVE